MSHNRGAAGPLFTALGLTAAMALAALGLPHCADKSNFDDAGVTVTDSRPWTYDGQQTGDSFVYVNPCSPNPPPKVTGKVYAPNGVDPVAGASVHVALGLMPLSPTVQCESCAATGKFSAHTYAKADGSFVLEGVPNNTSFWLGIQKGHFRRYQNIKVESCGTLALTKEQTTLPGKNKQFGPYDSVPNIAVVTGVWDKMEKVLEKLGVPAEGITLYNGRDFGSGPQSMQNLFGNAAKMRTYHMILINCGTQFESLVTGNDPIYRNAIHDYVHAGGRLFVTDLSYDFVEQVFPAYIDFERSEETGPTIPETPDAAEVGVENLTVPATIEDGDLKAWLGLPEINALRPDGTVEVIGFSTGWAVQLAANEQLGAKVWASGPVKWIGGQGPRPLTTSFDYLGQNFTGCGRVTFSSYHTHGSATELLPQERILEYLLLEIGTCVDLK